MASTGLDMSPISIVFLDHHCWSLVRKNFEQHLDPSRKSPGSDKLFNISLAEKTNDQFHANLKVRIRYTRKNKIIIKVIVFPFIHSTFCHVKYLTLPSIMLYFRCVNCTTYGSSDSFLLSHRSMEFRNTT